MGYDQSTYLFYGVEIEAPGWEKLESLPSGDISWLETGSMATGEYEHTYIFFPEFHRTVAEGRYVMYDAINVSELVNSMDQLFQMNLGIKLREYAKAHNLKVIGIPGYIVASSGG